MKTFIYILLFILCPYNAIGIAIPHKESDYTTLEESVLEGEIDMNSKTKEGSRTKRADDTIKFSCFQNMLNRIKNNAQNVINGIDDIIDHLQSDLDASSQSSSSVINISKAEEDTKALTDISEKEKLENDVDDVDNILQTYSNHKHSMKDPFCDHDSDINESVTLNKTDLVHVADDLEIQKLNKWKQQIESCKELLRLHSVGPQDSIDNDKERLQVASSIENNPAVSDDLEIEKENVWTDWSTWTPCSASCGMGRQVRYRKCASKHCPADIEVDEKECLNTKCDDKTHSKIYN